MSHPYVKDTQIWVPIGPSDWVKGEIIWLDQPASADAETYVTLKIRYGSDQTELEYSYPLGVLTAAGQSQFSAVSPTSSTGTSVGTPLPGKDADGKPVPLPPLRNPDELERSEDLADLSNLNEPSGTPRSVPSVRFVLVNSLTRNAVSRLSDSIARTERTVSA